MAYCNRENSSGRWSVISGQWLIAGFRRPPSPFPLRSASRPAPRAPRAPSAFTLIEMLVVITIMVLLMTIVATAVVPATASRRSREAARAINVYLSSARNRAMETGRPCGVIFHHFGTTTCSMNIDQCEVPPCYCGATEGATAQAQLQAAGGNTMSVIFYESGSPSPVPLIDSLVRPGDFIQLNGQGVVYAVAPTNTGTNPPINPVDANGYLTYVGAPEPTPQTTPPTVPLTVTFDNSQGQLVPWPTGSWSAPMPYRIVRFPIKSGAAPLQLPAGAVVDLSASGVGTETTYFGANDITIMFSPNGSVLGYYSGTWANSVTDPIYLLIGKRERVGNSFVAAPTTANRSQWPNYQDLDNIWVTINSQTGMIATSPVAGIAVAATEADAIANSRTAANDAQGMGGK